MYIVGLSAMRYDSGAALLRAWRAGAQQAAPLPSIVGAARENFRCDFSEWRHL